MTMNSGYLVLGTVLLLIAALDLLWTTLWIEEGAGPLTARLMAGLWTTIRSGGSHRPRVLTLTGPLILLTSLLMWIVLLWSGWTFLLASTEPAIVDTLNRGAISWSDRIYFVGYTLFTLGNGDFAPKPGVWQVVTTGISASGMLFITMSVTYILSVLDAVTQKRSFASNVSGLGSDGTAIVRTSWNGETFDGLSVPLNTLSTELNTLTSNHKAYPILHYFYSRQPEQAPANRIPALDEALLLLRFGVAEHYRPPEMVLQPAHASVENYLGTLSSAFITPADRTPPPPELARLREAGIPTVSDDTFAESIEPLEQRRRALLGLVEADVREWPSPET